MRYVSEAEFWNWRLVTLILSVVIMPLWIGRAIASGSYLFILLFLFSCLVLFFYLKLFELFIMMTFIINHNVFYLLPLEPMGKYSYESLLLVVLFITIVVVLLIKLQKKDVFHTQFGILMICFLIMSILGAFNSSYLGQPLMLGLKKAIFVFSPIIFYFIFQSKKIDDQRLFNLIVVIGVCLALLNNIQYLFYGKLNLFQHTSEFVRLARAGHLRYLVGGFFTIFSPIVALSQYLTMGRKRFLLAFIYMAGTVVLQSQTRAVIWGFLVTGFFMFSIAKKIQLKKILFIGVPIGVFLIWFLPFIQSGRWGEFYQLTKSEITNREGNWGVRLDAYDFYFAETIKSPLIGRGIWNETFDVYLGDNQEDRGPGGTGLVDIGIMMLLFRFGLIGALWLVLLLSKVYRTMFLRFGELKKNVQYFVAGYFVFGLATILTIDCFTQQGVIIYLALNLALLSQVNGSAQTEDTL